MNLKFKTKKNGPALTLLLSCMPKNLLLVLVSKEVLDTLSSNSSSKLEKLVVTKLVKKSWW